MSDNTQLQTHTIHFGQKLAAASRTDQSHAISGLIQDWKKSHGRGPEFDVHKGAKENEAVLTVKGALSGELLAASLRGFIHRRVECKPAAATTAPAPAPSA